MSIGLEIGLEIFLGFYSFTLESYNWAQIQVVCVNLVFKWGDRNIKYYIYWTIPK